jgi:hypothetical protein
MHQHKIGSLFEFVCYGGTPVKRVDFKSTEQFYQCPYIGDLIGGFPCCKDCDGKMEGYALRNEEDVDRLFDQMDREGDVT